MNKVNNIVVYLTPTQLSLCVSGQMHILLYPEGSVRDQEVVDALKLHQTITDWLTSLKIGNGRAIFVLARNLCFSQEVTTSEAMQEFVDSVPFVNTTAKIFDKHIVVINRHFYDVIAESFISTNILVISVVPEFVLQSLKAVGEVSAKTCRLILAKSDFLQEHSFISQSENTITAKKWKITPAAIILIVLQIGLFAVVGFLLWQRQINKPSPVTLTVTVTPTILPTQVPTPTSFPVGELTVQILNGSKKPGLAGQIKTQLETLKLTSIQIGNAESPTFKTQTIFTSRVDLILREQIIKMLETVFSQVTAIENATNIYDISITTGQLL